MGRKAEQNKLTTGANGVQLEQNTIYDDNLLPAADELAKLHALDNDIIPWIKKRTEVEQDGRVWFNKKRLKLAGREINFAGASTILGLLLAAGLMAFFFYLSYNLILDGHEILGGIFGFADVCGLLSVLTKFQMRKNC
ncbi:MAG: hypothetical protein HFJ91_00835 [Muribaculaceae bacterium]|nr:hypothetical protein [Muribaculaceae bacterium]